jgi:hypothetical protein
MNNSSVATLRHDLNKSRTSTKPNTGFASRRDIQPKDSSTTPENFENAYADYIDGQVVANKESRSFFNMSPLVRAH